MKTNTQNTATTKAAETVSVKAPKVKSASATAHRNYVNELKFVDGKGELQHPCVGGVVGAAQAPRHHFATQAEAAAMLAKVQAKLGDNLTTSRIYKAKAGYTVWATTKPIQNVRKDRVVKNEIQPRTRWFGHKPTAAVLEQLGYKAPVAPKAEAKAEAAK